VSVSVLILTLKEERNLEKCLSSLAWTDDIVVLDSGSTDNTLGIALAHDARIVEREFDDWSSHLNWALCHIKFKYPWVYYSDADEVVTEELARELTGIGEEGQAHDKVAYWVRYKNFFWGRWIKHCGIYPVWVMRFFRPEKILWERMVNPKPVIDGDSGHLQEHFEHYSFNKGIREWFEKHARYSYGEAQEGLKELSIGQIHWQELVDDDDKVRRKALQKLSLRLPFRPLLRFIYMYFFKLGILDGWPGYTYCRLLSIYEYMIDIQIKELRRRQKKLEV
jgi:glycosyltransferase involved in cell wall biosynthesis